MRRRMKSDHGAAIVEFALVVPILIMLVFGIAEFGRAWFTQSNLAAAAREGARATALAKFSVSGAAGENAAKTVLIDTKTSGTVQPIGNCPDPSTIPSGGTPPNVTVTITHTWKSATGLFNFPVTLTGKGVMRCNG